MTDRQARVLSFNDRSIAAAPYYGSDREAEYRIEGNPGLILAVVRPNRKGQSKRTWRVQYSLTKDGRQAKRKLWLGRYPALCLADARAGASKIMQAVDRGEDPIAQAEAAKTDDEHAALTLRDLAEDYLADQRQAGVARTSEVERAIRRDAFPTLADKRPSQITDVDIEKLVDGVAARGSRAIARHLLTYLRGMFNHALRGAPRLRHKYGLVFNPTDTVGRGRRGRPGKYGRPVPRDRVLNDEEIVALWHAVEASQLVPSTKIIFKLLVLTGQRLGEVRKTYIDELRLEGRSPYWDLPGRRTKNRMAHIVPLSPPAAKLFREALDMTLIAEREAQLAAAPQEAKPALAERLAWMKSLDMAVVVSQGQNEIAELKAKGLDILPHRERMQKEDLETRFKNADDPLRLVFVCAMWITGFDVPTCSTVYLDKPMKNHTLMQTIARANRRAPGKTAGVVVDYVGVFQNLQKALAVYGAKPDGDSPIKDKDGLVEALVAALTVARASCTEAGVDIDAIPAATKLARLALIADAVERLIASDERRREFMRRVAAASRAYRALLPWTSRPSPG